MDRRTFLKTLAALGASVTFPDVAQALPEQIDAAYVAASRTWHLFEVDDFGTLSHANFEEPGSRRAAYGFMPGTPGAEEIEACPPLHDYVVRYFAERLEDSGIDPDAAEAWADQHWDTWMKTADAQTQEDLRLALDRWLEEAPDWSFEDDYLYKSGNAQGAAYDYFGREPEEILDALSIAIIEGECPGSSYYAARLLIEPGEANRIAAAMGLALRFV